MVDVLYEPAVRPGRVNGRNMILGSEPGPVTCHQVLVFPILRVKLPGPVQGPGSRVRELTLPLVPSEGGLDDFGPEPLVIAHDSEVIAELREDVGMNRPRQLWTCVSEPLETFICHSGSIDI